MLILNLETCLCLLESLINRISKKFNKFLLEILPSKIIVDKLIKKFHKINN